MTSRWAFEYVQFKGRFSENGLDGDAFPTQVVSQTGPIKSLYIIPI